MQSSRVTVSVLSSLLMMCLFSSVRAQEKPSKAQLSELVLEVTVEGWWEPVEIPATERPAHFFGGISEIPSWRPPVDRPAAAGILIKVSREGDVFSVALSVALQNEKKLAVATYKVGENE